MSDIDEAWMCFKEGEDHYKKREYGKAIEDFTRVIALKKYLPDAYANRGSACANKGDYGKAIEDYVKAMELGRTDATVYYCRGRAYANSGDYTKAVEDYDKAIELGSKDAMIYCDKGVAYANKKNWEKAVEDYDKAISLGLKNAIVYYNRGVAYVGKGDFSKAIVDFSEAIELNPKDFDYYNNRGIAYASKGKHNKAIEDFSKVIELNSKHAGSYHNRGVSYGNRGEHGKAIEDFSETIRLEPKYFKAYYDRSLAYGNTEDWENAIKDSSKAIGLNSKYLEAYYVRGLAYTNKGDCSKAISDFNKSILLGTNTSLYIAEYIYNCVKAGTIDTHEFHDIANEIIKHDMKVCEKPKKNILYKYREYEKDAFEKTIANESIRLSDFNFFNDPADPPFKLAKDTFRDMEDITGKIKIASLSETYDSILMWSHYADSHKGLCIAYDIDNFSHKNCTIKKVIYSHELKLNTDNSFFDLYNEKHNEYYFLSLFYIKHKDWRYEKEYRIISYNTATEYIKLKIKAIYIGTDATDETIDNIKKFTEGKGIDLYKMEKDKDNLFKINATKISEKDIIA